MEEKMPVSKEEFRRVVGCFATGVTVVTTRDPKGYPYGLTVNAFTSVSLDPLLVLICIDKNRRGHESFQASGFFAVNILTEEQKEISTTFATRNSTDRFANLNYKEGITGAPILNDALAFLECRIVHAYEGGDHTIFIGEVQRAETLAQKDPLIFYGGGYAGLKANRS